MRVFLMTVMACGLGLALTAGAPAASGPDLVVSAGSVVVRDGKLVGRVSFRNAGSARAAKSSAELTVLVRGKRRFVAEITVLATRPGLTRVADVSASVPKGLPRGSFALRVCADVGRAIAERSEANNCRRVGTLRRGGGSGAGGSLPPAPIDYETDKPFELQGKQGPYWLTVPPGYDGSHRTPYSLFVWMHGCGGDSGGDIFSISPGGGEQRYLAVSLGGRDGECWNPGEDQAKVLAAIADVGRQFNVDRRRVILGGYSSGGDLAYRTAFFHSARFAGVLAENTSPFRDTGASQKDALAAAKSKFHVVHLAHTGDDTYPIDGVRAETRALADAGFPVELIERPGAHYDDNTDRDLQTLLLPHIDDGWKAGGR